MGQQETRKKAGEKTKNPHVQAQAQRTRSLSISVFMQIVADAFFPSSHTYGVHFGRLNRPNADSPGVADGDGDAGCDRNDQA